MRVVNSIQARRVHVLFFPEKSVCVGICAAYTLLPARLISPRNKTFIIRGGGGFFNKVSVRDTKFRSGAKIISFVKCVRFGSSAYESVFNSRASGPKDKDREKEERDGEIG